MALRTDRDELLAAWRALSGPAGADGWRTIQVAHGGPCPLLAGRRFPGNEEALLVGLDSARVPSAELLPQGKGFTVIRVEFGGKDPERTWIALCRQSQGSLDLFALMAEDVVAILDTLRNADGERLVRVFLARIRAWQEFMRRGDDGILSPEAEVGLYGELVTLQALIDAGLSPAVAVEAWQGPLGGIQDFSLGTGAIEVKSTVSPSGFPAKVGSLDQLDDSLIAPIFLAGVRLALSPAGRTLPELIAGTRTVLRLESLALATFDSRLIDAGFLDVKATTYTRRFSVLATRLLSVSDNFPRLTRANVAMEIRAARYDLDLDLVKDSDAGISDALEQLGVI